MELLCPAGSPEALRAAVENGANAVYLGLTAFGARASAANFTPEELVRAVRYCHERGVRVHVTVNTLVKDDELAGVYETLQAIDAARADAVIVQDAGVCRVVRACFPALKLHASTQMAIHSASGARFAQSLGAARVVLARECTLPEIAEVARTGIETEVFVHGALCVSVSGQCLLSSIAGGRSGNRGRCAQPCRQPLTLNGQTAFHLSPRDLCLRDDLPALRDAGVTSLKIEGRLKRPEYVAAVTRVYRNALDALASGRFRPADARERMALLQAFNRGGFTRGHAMGAEDAALIGLAHGGSSGVCVGTVASFNARAGLASVRVSRALHVGDTLRVAAPAREDGGLWSRDALGDCAKAFADAASDATRGEGAETVYAGLAASAGETAVVRLRPGDACRAGDIVWRMADAALDAEALAGAREPIPVEVRVSLKAYRPALLTATDGTHTAQVVGEAAQRPLSAPLSVDAVRRCVEKRRDTPFLPTLAECEGAEGGVLNDVFYPMSALGAMQKQALSELLEARVAELEGARAGAKALDAAYGAGETRGSECELRGGNAQAATKSDFPRLWAATRDPALAQALLNAGANRVLFEPTDLRAEPLAEALSLLPDGAWLRLPPFLTENDLNAARVAVAARGARLGGVALGSVGQIGADFGETPVALSEGVPITNALALRELRPERFTFVTAFPELNARELAALPLEETPFLLPVYGRERLMILSHCPVRTALGMRRDRAACAMCAQGRGAAGQALRDRKGYEFPMLPTRLADGCRVSLYNALPTSLHTRAERLRALPCAWLVRFTTEDADTQAAITRAYRALLDGDVLPDDAPDTFRETRGAPAYTAGHFARGVL